MSQPNNSIQKFLDKYSEKFEYNNKETAIILAAGHGKRIKSQTSKMQITRWTLACREKEKMPICDSNIAREEGVDHLIWSV